MRSCNTAGNPEQLPYKSLCHTSPANLKPRIAQFPSWSPWYCCGWGRGRFVHPGVTWWMEKLPVVFSCIWMSNFEVGVIWPEIHSFQMFPICLFQTCRLKPPRLNHASQAVSRRTPCFTWVMSEIPLVHEMDNWLGSRFLPKILGVIVSFSGSFAPVYEKWQRFFRLTAMEIFSVYHL